MKKTTIQELAQKAGVSTATVDRVLHKRRGVSEGSKLKVKAAMQQLGFRGFADEKLGMPRPRLRNKFLLPNLETGFAEQMVAAVKVASGAVDDAIVLNDIERVDLRDGKSVIRELDALDPAVYDGVALFAVDAPGVRQAIDRAVERGIKVVSIVTDIPTSRRHYFIGTDNASAGRVAANLMGKFLRNEKGKLAVVAGSLQMRDQLDRYFGFEQVIRSNFPGLRILPVEEGDSVRRRNASLTTRLLEKHDDLLGIYSAGAGNSGILDAFDELGVTRRPLLVVHELSERVRVALADDQLDAVIVQDAGHIARSAVRILRSYCLRKPILEPQERIRIEIYLADNLP